LNGFAQIPGKQLVQLTKSLLDSKTICTGLWCRLELGHEFDWLSIQKLLLLHRVANMMTVNP
jgi:hypothetical protein